MEDTAWSLLHPGSTHDTPHPRSPDRAPPVEGTPCPATQPQNSLLEGTRSCPWAVQTLWPQACEGPHGLEALRWRPQARASTNSYVKACRVSGRPWPRWPPGSAALCGLWAPVTGLSMQRDDVPDMGPGLSQGRLLQCRVCSRAGPKLHPRTVFPQECAHHGPYPSDCGCRQNALPADRPP